MKKLQKKQNKKQKTVKAEYWKLTVSFGGALGIVHGCEDEIREIYVPKYKLAINNAENSLNYFYVAKNDERYTAKTEAILIKKFNISLDLVLALCDNLSKKVWSKDQVDELFNNLLDEDPEFKRK